MIISSDNFNILLTCGQTMSEIYPLADTFDLSPRPKQNEEGKNRKNTNSLVWLQHENVYLQKS